MNHPVTIVVLEPAPRWVPELQRQFVDESVTVRACRSAADFRERITLSQTGTPFIAIIDLGVGLSTGLTLVAWLDTQDAAGTVAIGNDHAITLEPSLRELGATAVHAESLQGSRLAEECRRFVQTGSH